MRGFSQIFPKDFAQNKQSDLYYASVVLESGRNLVASMEYTPRESWRETTQVLSPSLLDRKEENFDRNPGWKYNFKNENDQQVAEPFQILVNLERIFCPIKSKRS